MSLYKIIFVFCLVLLVNADQANAANQQFTMMGKTLTPILPKATANNLCQQQQQQIHEQQQKKQDQQTKKQAQQNRREEQQRKKDALSKSELISMKFQ